MIFIRIVQKSRPEMTSGLPGKKNYLNLFGTWLLEGDFVVNALGCVIK